MFLCTNCNSKNCIIGSNGESTSFNKNDISKRINNSVRLSSSLHLMQKATQTVNALRPTFKTQSDRFQTSRNPITNKRGVDKKHNSYARYLARKKGKTICCCACTQLVTRTAGVVATLWPHTIPIGAEILVPNNPGGKGVVVVVNKSGGAIDSIIIRSENCLRPFKLVTPGFWAFVIPTSSGTTSGSMIVEDPAISMKTINKCQ